MIETLVQYSTWDQQLNCFEPDPETVVSTSQQLLRLGELAMQFAAVERVPRYHEFHRENDAEHSFMLGLLATELCTRHFPELNSGLVAHFSLVHDLVELETGDVATFTLNHTEIKNKEAVEQEALCSIVAKLPPATATLLLRYEAQTEPEARFVRLVDKILPVIVDIVGPGKQVMEEDYDIRTAQQLDANEALLSARLRNSFPEADFTILHAIRDTFADQFSKQFAA